MQSKIKEALTLFKFGSYDEVIKICKKEIDNNTKDPNIFHLLAFIYFSKNNYKNATIFWNKTLEIDKNFVEAYNGLGNVQFKLKNFDESLKNFQKAFSIQPNHNEVLCNLGNVLNALKKYSESIKYFDLVLKNNLTFDKALYGKGFALLKLKNYHEALSYFKKINIKNLNQANLFNYIGICFNHLKNFENAVENYSKCLEFDKFHEIAIGNLLNILTYYTPKKDYDNLIVKINSNLKDKNYNLSIDNELDDESLVNTISKIYKLVDNDYFKNFQFVQIFRRNKIKYDCDRHFKVFNSYNVIPEFCFGCYKIQFNLKNILDLFKLYLIFNNLNLLQKFFKKTIVEVRPNIPGSYKGFIYCSSAKEANSILHEIKPVIKKHFDKNIINIVKRGCTEYAMEYNNFDKIDEQVKYNPDWKEKENIIDNKIDDASDGVYEYSLNEMNINDALALRNWITYAKKINDQKIKLFKLEINETKKINELLFNQLDYRRQEYLKQNID